MAQSDAYTAYPLRGVLSTATSFCLLRDVVNGPEVFTLFGTWNSLADTEDEQVAFFTYQCIDGGFALTLVSDASIHLSLGSMTSNGDYALVLLPGGNVPLRNFRGMMRSNSLNNGWQLLVTGVFYRYELGNRTSAPFTLFPSRVYSSTGQLYTNGLQVARQLRVRTYQSTTNTINYFTNELDAQYGQLYRYCYLTGCNWNCKGPCQYNNLIGQSAVDSGADTCVWSSSEVSQDNDAPSSYPVNETDGFRCLNAQYNSSATIDMLVVLAFVVLIGALGAVFIYMIRQYSFARREIDRCD